MDINEVMTIHQIAERMEITAASARKYYYRGMIPEPDAFIGKYPVWRITAIDRFLAARPGKGVTNDPSNDHRRSKFRKAAKATVHNDRSNFPTT